MLQLTNRTELPVKMFALPDPDGVDALHVVVQATFALTPDAPLADVQRPIALVDEMVGEGAAARPRTPSVVHPAKPYCEVLLDGEAVAPWGRAVTALDVGIAVASWRRVIRVVGDRVFTGVASPWCTDPVPFERMPLTPERAFGGTFAPHGATDARNPAGVGYAPSDVRDLRPLRGLALPNLEDPAAWLQQPGDAPPPVIVSPVGASWAPRAARAGTYDDAWDQHRAPFLPTDFDARFTQSGADAMWLPARLQGGEPIVLHHLADAPVVEARVPTLGIRVVVTVRGEAREVPALAETLHLFPSEGLATLSLRATLRCGHRILQVSSVDVTREGRA